MIYHGFLCNQLEIASSSERSGLLAMTQIGLLLGGEGGLWVYAYLLAVFLDDLCLLDLSCSCLWKGLAVHELPRTFEISDMLLAVGEELRLWKGFPFLEHDEGRDFFTPHLVRNSDNR